MFSIFSSMNSQLVQTINDYQENISAYCAANNVNSNTFPLLLGICVAAPFVATIDVTIKIAESVQQTVAPVSTKLIESTRSLTEDVVQTIPNTAHAIVAKAIEVTPSVAYAIVTKTAEIAPVLANEMAQVTLTLANKAGSVALEGMYSLHDKLIANNSSDTFASSDHIATKYSLEDDFVIVELMGSEPTYPADPAIC